MSGYADCRDALADVEQLAELLAGETLTDVRVLAERLRGELRVLEAEERDEDRARGMTNERAERRGLVVAHCVCGHLPNGDHNDGGSCLIDGCACDALDMSSGGLVSDPTGLAALGQSAKLAQLRSARRQVEAEINRARKAILSARGCIEQATKQPKKPTSALDASNPAWCSNCRSNPPRTKKKSGICRWCADFRHDHVRLSDGEHELPNTQIVDRFTRCGRLMPRDLAAAGYRRVTDLETVPA